MIKNYYGVHDPKFSYLAYPGCSQAAVELHEKIYKEKLNESNENFMVNYFKHIMSFNTGFNSLLDEDKNQLNSSLLENCWKNGVTLYVFSDTAQLTSYIFPQNWKLKQIMQAVKEVVKHGGWYYSDLDGGRTFTANINNMCVNVYLNKDNEITNFKLLPWFDILKKFDSQELADKNREFLKSTDGDKRRFLPTSEKTDGLRTIKFSQYKVPNINMMFEENL